MGVEISTPLARLRPRGSRDGSKISIPLPNITVAAVRRIGRVRSIPAWRMALRVTMPAWAINPRRGRSKVVK
jgi:hypothetical protein